MPLMPKRVKYRKSQRGSRKGTASRNLRIDFGEFGLQTLERAWITNTQIEAARVALTRNMKRKGKLWIRIFPDKSVTARPPETRMGRGKGKPKHWGKKARPGRKGFICVCNSKVGSLNNRAVCDYCAEMWPELKRSFPNARRKRRRNNLCPSRNNNRRRKRLQVRSRRRYPDRFPVPRGRPLAARGLGAGE